MPAWGNGWHTLRYLFPLAADEAVGDAAQDGLFLASEQEEAGGEQHAGGGGETGEGETEETGREEEDRQQADYKTDGGGTYQRQKDGAQIGTKGQSAFLMGIIHYDHIATYSPHHNHGDIEPCRTATPRECQPYQQQWRGIHYTLPYRIVLNIARGINGSRGTGSRSIGNSEGGTAKG